VRDYLVGCKLFHNILNTERPGDLPTRFGQPGYRPIMYWIQAFGGVRLRTRNGVQQPPWRPQPEDLPPDWFWPAFLFAPRPTPATTDLDYERLRAIPTPDQLRTVSWASMILLSEGLPVFALHGIPSSLLLTSDTLPEESDGRYAAVAKEILYFARLRWNLAGNDRSDLLNAQWSSRPLAGSGWQQGATLFVHFPDGTTESEEWWLLLRNFGTEPVALAMQPALGTGTPGPGRVLVEYRFQQQVRDPITDEVIFFRHTQPVALRLEPISVRLFRLETPPPP
ncbi:MAG TPA: hypothetical protein VEI97_05590, partial [bacterium]|nr:hypothetical protein [bacterium]